MSSNNTRANRAKGIKCFGEADLGRRMGANQGRIHLPLSRRHIIPHGIANNVIVGFFLGDVLGVLANDKHQLAFVVGLVVLCDLGDFNIATMTGNGCGKLGEHGWKAGETDT